MKNRTRILMTRATTPPNFLGMARRIAYANRKYHSGRMWTGVCMGFAFTQFSGSPKDQGENMKTPPARPISAKFDMSFKENLGVNFTFENLSCRKMGEVLLLSCKNRR
jgi:hypothetical protein